MPKINITIETETLAEAQALLQRLEGSTPVADPETVKVETKEEPKQTVYTLKDVQGYVVKASKTGKLPEAKVILQDAGVAKVSEATEEQLLVIGEPLKELVS